MKYGDLPIYRAPEHKKVEGFSLVELFFREFDEEANTMPILAEDILRAPRGVFQALSLLIDFGHLEEANKFITTYPCILRTAFEIKPIDVDEDGIASLSKEYETYTPLLLIAPYLVRKHAMKYAGYFDQNDDTANGANFVRPLFYRYSKYEDLYGRYSRNVLQDTLNLWFRLGLDLIVKESLDKTNYSVLSLAIEMQFDSAYLDTILKFSLQSPMYADSFKKETAIQLLKSSMSILSVSDIDADRRSADCRYAALRLTTYLKYDGESLFDKEKVKGGNLNEVHRGLSLYFAQYYVDKPEFGLLCEIFYIILRGKDILSDSHVIMLDTMKLFMEIHALDPVTMLSIVKTEDQRLLIMSILKGD